MSQSAIGAGLAHQLPDHRLWNRGTRAVQNPFLESVQTIAELTGVAVSKRSLEEILPDAAQDFDAFYRQRSVATVATVFTRAPWVRTSQQVIESLFPTSRPASGEADLWVLDRTLRILFGEVGQVVKGIRQSITKRGLSGR